MATPTLSASLNKSSYAPGEVMTLTVTYADADSKTTTTTITGTDQAGNAASVAVTVRVVDPVTLSVSEVPARAWTKQSDNGSVAVYTATA